MINNYKYKIEELELKLEGIDVDKYRKDNDVITNMTRDFKHKEDLMNKKMKDLENKIKFYVENQDLLEEKNEYINQLERNLDATRKNKDIDLSPIEDTNNTKNNTKNSTKKSKNDIDSEIR